MVGNWRQQASSRAPGDCYMQEMELMWPDGRTFQDRTEIFKNMKKTSVHVEISRCTTSGLQEKCTHLRIGSRSLSLSGLNFFSQEKKSMTSSSSHTVKIRALLRSMCGGEPGLQASHLA